MKSGGTGQPEPKNNKWAVVEKKKQDELSKVAGVGQALSSLAAGTDQVFSEAAISLGISVVAVVPLEGYERLFEGSSLANYRRLLGQSEVVQLTWRGNPERAFFEAGKYI